MEALKEKLKDNVLIEATTGCWLWQMSCNRNGYGQLGWDGKTKNVHRLAYTAFIGEIPKGYLVRHTCDTPQCCNPEHLLVGTTKDNINDKVVRGRSTFGEKNHHARLTWADVEAMRSSSEPASVLADTYGISERHTRHILNNTRWVVKTS